MIRRRADIRSQEVREGLPNAAVDPGTGPASESTPRGAIHARVARSALAWPGTGLASLDLQLQLVEANMDFFQQFGGSPRNRCGRSLLDLIHPRIREPIRQQFTALIGSDRRHFTERVAAPSAHGHFFSGTLTGIATRDLRGRTEAILVVMKPDSPSTRRTN